MKIIKEIVPYLVVIVLVILVRTFIVTPVRVDGASMYSTLSNNDLLLLKKYDKSYDRFDIVVFKYNNKRLIKRVIGLPGEHVQIKDNSVYINGEKLEENYLQEYVITEDLEGNYIDVIVPENTVYVLGDNRGESTDSRRFGCIPVEKIESKAVFRFWPLNKIGGIYKDVR